MSLCAGVGGLELGVRIARPGARGVCYLEREVPAAARLVARMQDGSLHPAPIWSDLTTFDGLPWRGLVDCLTSGDPCQPNSVAGKGLGKDDDRWLLDHVFRIIDEVRPARVFRENVPGNADGQLAAIVPALEGMGYRVAAGIFSARGAGASHLRERLFIMADRDGDGSCSIAGSGLHDDQHHAQPRDRNLVHASGNGRREGRPEPELRSRRDTSAVTGGAMGDALGRGDGRQSAEPGRGTIVGATADGAGDCGVGQADTGCSGLQRFRDGDYQSGRQEPHGHAGLEGRAGLLFAPGPNDPAWVQIIGSASHLAPAVSDAHVAQALILREAAEVGWSGDPEQAQSVLRRLDAWLAQRVDRLRAGGNGVSSLAAALAWRTLEASLAADLGRSTQPLRLKDQAA
ncbi:DNA cytosine methyltransferase [Brevundimonas sp.]|uniref:DNA cytosine methyltransferase n=1 Tax=Brevundimonas sp. TaxID=1871086 RepID=UPI0039182905